MILIDFTNDQNSTFISMSYLRLYFHIPYIFITDQSTHQRKNLKLAYLHCYTRGICKI